MLSEEQLRELQPLGAAIWRGIRDDLRRGLINLENRRKGQLSEEQLSELLQQLKEIREHLHQLSRHLVQMLRVVDQVFEKMEGGR